MAIEYSKVLSALDISFDIVGRGKKSAINFEKKVGKKVITGGIDSYIRNNKRYPELAINAVGVEDLPLVTNKLLDAGFNKILVEKPVSLNINDVQLIKKNALKKNAKVYVAYNRRFYASTIKSQEIILNDGGVLSFNFEFTEWSHVIKKLKKSHRIKQNWLLANSTHVIDLAFFLGGIPESFSSYVGGGLDWHPSGSIFSGAGKTKSNALFSYNANWEAPGRWFVEILTNKHRLILKPLELLKIQNLGSNNIESCDINNRLDVDYKPGLFEQIKAFIDSSSSSLCDINEHYNNYRYYIKILSAN